jgi:hydrogenase maturation protease
MMNIKIIGLGNSFRGDDAVGNVVARQLFPHQGPSVSIIEGGVAGLNLLHEMEGTDKLILIDAVSSQSEEGTITRFTVPQDLDIIARLAWSTSGSSTHDLGLQEALTLANTLRALPPSVVIYGIELGRVDHGVELSPKVEEAVHTVVNRIAHEELNLFYA